MSKGKQLITEIENDKVSKGKPSIWWVGQMGLLVKGAGKIFAIDCFLTDIPVRLVPPIINSEEFSIPDFILGTHDHADHIDRDMWKIAAEVSNAKFVIPNYHMDILPEELGIEKSRFIGISDMKTVELAEGVKISGVASAHEFLDYDSEKEEYPYMGYVLEIEGFKIYNCGDCCNYEGLQTKLEKFGKIDLMILPIPGRDAYRYTHDCIGNMTYQEAVDLSGLLKPGIALPGHYDTFKGNTENPEKFREYMSVKFPDQKVWIGAPGDKVTY